MRWFHLAVIVLFAAVTTIFAVQNLQIVTVSLLRISAQIPLAFLVAIIYLLGAGCCDRQQPVRTPASGSGASTRTGFCHLE